MKVNNKCGCGNISTTTSSCSTCCAPAPVAVCVPTGMPTSGSLIAGSPSHPTVTIDNLLTLIETRCDEKTCKLLQFEITHLYEYVRAMKPDASHPDHPDHKPTKPIDPNYPDAPVVVVPPVAIPPVAWQLVENITATLQGDLTDKYPNADLLK
ncbi:MAG: hypothetical protein J7J70_06425, partial [Deltaproteobacteria bacterium]|nr:hypothetical protein [Candidatus Tharpellaceae bacterium]